MSKTLLIAKREYLAFVKTIGFWLSLVTLPLLITAVIAVPLLLRQTAPVTVLSVAVLDLSGDHVEGDLDALIRAQATQAEGLEGLAAKMAHADQVRLAALPAGLDVGMTPAEAEAKIPAMLNAPDAKVSNIIVVYDQNDVLQFHIWSTQKQKGKLADRLQWDLHGLQYYKLAREHGVDAQLAHDMRESRANIVSLTPVAEGGGDGFSQALRENAPRLAGMLTGYLAWMSIFSSSMILLSGVIEEKSSKVLEVVLASSSAESLLIGKVLGVAGVLLSVACIWALGGWALAATGMSFIPPEILHGVQAGLSGLFSPLHIALLVVYFACGYLMFGVSFAAIGAFCETQKDAQAIMGPMMIVLMIPMLCMQSAMVAPDSPVIRWLSFVPIFTPFLMPLRLADSVPWWEIALSLGLMIVVAWLMIGVGRRAFRQGALAGGRLSWGRLARIATKREGM
ncbi:MAG TPA: ABC transporter permease [Asticcacaulis sp.]|nr:ABC transporter permease [Asticcacaulis sp.]